MKRLKWCIILFFVTMVIFAQSSCKFSENQQPIDNDKSKEIISPIYEQNGNVEMTYDFEKYAPADYFSKIVNVSYANGNTYLLGKRHDDYDDTITVYDINTKEPKKTFKLDNDQEYLYFEDKIYQFIKKEDNYTKIKIYDIVNGEISYIDNIKCDLKIITSIYVNKNGTIYYTDLHTKIYRYDIENKNTDVFDISVLNFLVSKFCVDDEENIYLFGDNDNKTLQKFDSSFKLVYSNDNFYDMPGFINTILFEDDNIVLKSRYEDMQYINIVDKETGETIKRDEVQYSHNNEYTSFYNIDEGENLISVTSCGDPIISKYCKANSVYEALILNGDDILNSIECICNYSDNISKMCIDNSGNFYYIEETYSPEFITSEKAFHIIHKISNDGTHSFFDVSVYNVYRNPLFICTGENGEIFLGEESDGILYIRSFDVSGNMLYEKEINNYVSFGSCAEYDGEQYISYFIQGEKKVVDCISKEKNSIIIYDDQRCDYIFSGNGNNDLFVSDKENIYNYDIETKNFDVILNFLNTGISMNISEIYNIGNDFLINGNGEYYIIKYSEKKEEKQIIKLSGMGVSYIIGDKIVEFNNTNEKYRVECNDYDFEEQAVNKLNTDIVSQNVDMVMFVSGNDICSYDYNKYVFSDLNVFIDSDCDIKRNDYFQSIFDLYSDNDKLYEIVVEYNIWSFLEKSNDVKQKMPLSIDELLSKTKSEKISVNRDMLARYMISGYVKNENFIDEDFKKILEFLKNNVSDYEYAGITHEDVLNGNSLFTVNKNICNNSELVLRGFPGSYTNGIVVDPKLSFSIIENSDNKDGAWEFIKSFMNDEFQNSISDGLPLKISSFEKKFEENEELSKVYIDAVNNADGKYIGNSKFYDIIDSEIFLYFNDEISIDELIKELKSKINIYYSEKNN